MLLDEAYFTRTKREYPHTTTTFQLTLDTAVAPYYATNSSQHIP